MTHFSVLCSSQANAKLVFLSFTAPNLKLTSKHFRVCAHADTSYALVFEIDRQQETQASCSKVQI